MKAPFQPRPGYQGYVLVILLLVYVLNFIDRQVLSLVFEDVKADLELSDAQLGSLSTAFAIFYTVAGIPIARLADVTSRRGVLAASVAIWSGLTAATGLVSSYWQMAVARFGVAIGEAGGTPPSHALISDYFPPERRATAMAVYGWGIFIGTAGGFIGGGLVVAAFDWRTAFFVAGALGLPLVLLMATVKEPPAGVSEGRAGEEAPPVLEVLGQLARTPSFVVLMLAAMCQAFLGYTVLTWGVSFLRRIFDMSVAEAGFAFGAIAGVAGVLGITLGGVLADRLSQRDPRWYGWISAVSSFSALPFALTFAWAEERDAALIAFGVFYFLNNIYVSILWTLVQNLSRPRNRATASATQMSILNISGMGIGPLMAGFVSDTLEPTRGDDGLRIALTLAAGVGACAGLFFLWMNRTLRVDLARVAAEEPPS